MQNQVWQAAAPNETVVGARVPTAMAEQLARLARENERTTSGEMRLALRRHLAAARQAA